MYGLLSVLLMGMVPVWGAQGAPVVLSQEIHIAAPAATQPESLASLDQHLTASGVIVVDLDSGQTLYQRNVDVSRPMASLTKLMTALIIVEHHSLDEIVTVPMNIGDVQGTVAHLPAGEKFTVGNLLSALLLDSANDAAVTLAQFHSGSVKNFVADMNQRAHELGLNATSYENPVGLDAPAQHASPRDLAWLAMYVMRKPEIEKRMSTPSMKISSLSGKTISLYHTHELVGDEHPLTDDTADDIVVQAGKTGTTDAAGQCLLSIVDTHGRRYIAILLHSRDRYADMRKILEALAHS
jgi:D-alanyl-D-alanine carboxypeptidase (penicillin-binding protein 5/6)